MRILLLIMLLATSTVAFPSEWVSPIDIKYKQKSLENYQSFDVARSILNSWGGENDKLIRADALLKKRH